ncbi:glycosyltransferase family 2 protein [Trichocoleus sp. FACHB-262]|uniref:glycosyltransferase family 2 protein n=1 Tax=Trichocoleus sp. FACHB-262 TaxID=2692869 RepID=UPI0016897171|nr:glycosyltransferase family 2 protein [Trichocoleus sp. FACHB-262]MBD2119876.1 glycosyltransferase family 2 protein [Trichocoleus sp. FACHB-262]
MDWQLTTPVVFIIFKRPNTSEKVFEVIRQAKPPKLLVIADGPRNNRPEEAEQCALTRAIVDQVDWNCEVLKNYSDTNLGLRERFTTGLNWAFQTVEEAIILEDDTLPSPTFFRFCQDLLERYRDDERVMTISGNNQQVKSERGGYSYRFSRYGSCWGWASWRRAWLQFSDIDMELWPEIRDSDWLTDLLQDPETVKFWTKVFQSCVDGKYRATWDYQWRFACWIQSGLSILPNSNMIRNIGFGPEATNTRNSDDWRAKVSLEEMIFPLKHPEFLIRDAQTDRLIQRRLAEVSQPGLILRARKKAKKILQNVFPIS